MSRRGRTPVRGGSSSENLDSLLDTMANVVGILIVLMAVIQLTVGDAMDRINVFDSDEGRSLRDEQLEIEAELAALGPAALAEMLSLDRLRATLRALRADPDAARLRTDAASASTAAAASAAEMRRLEREVSEKRRQLVAMRVRVEGREGDDPDAPVELRLPDPRPAPPNADPVVVVARYGRVLDPDLEALESKMNSAIQAWLAAGKGMRGHDARALAEHIEDLEIGNRWMRWEMREQSGVPVARLIWRDRGAGDDVAELRRKDADFRRSLAQLDPDRHYLTFLVWGDSFEPYLEARRVAEDAGFAVGWEALGVQHQLEARPGRNRARAAPVD